MPWPPVDHPTPQTFYQPTINSMQLHGFNTIIDSSTNFGMASGVNAHYPPEMINTEQQIMRTTLTTNKGGALHKGFDDNNLFQSASTNNTCNTNLFPFLLSDYFETTQSSTTIPPAPYNTIDLSSSLTSKSQVQSSGSPVQLPIHPSGSPRHQSRSLRHQSGSPMELSTSPVLLPMHLPGSPSMVIII